MFRYIVSAAADRFKHPFVATPGIVALVFVAIGVLIRQFAPFTIPVIGVGVPKIAGGFFGLYAIVTGAVTVVGYTVLYVAKFISMLRDQTAPHAG